MSSKDSNTLTRFLVYKPHNLDLHSADVAIKMTNMYLEKDTFKVNNHPTSKSSVKLLNLLKKLLKEIVPIQRAFQISKKVSHWKFAN